MLVLADPYSFATEALLDRLDTCDRPCRCSAASRAPRRSARPRCFGTATFWAAAPSVLAVGRIDPAVRLSGRRARRPRDDDHRRAWQRDRAAGVEAGDRAASRSACRSGSARAAARGVGPDARHRDRREQARVRARRLPGAPDHRCRRARPARSRSASGSGSGRPCACTCATPPRPTRTCARRSAPRPRRSAPPGGRRAAVHLQRPRLAHVRGRPITTRWRSRTRSGVPAGGFFCAGEIGPVGGRNFLHGFTATMALFAAE